MASFSLYLHKLKKNLLHYKNLHRLKFSGLQSFLAYFVRLRRCNYVTVVNKNMHIKISTIWFLQKRMKMY